MKSILFIIKAARQKFLLFLFISFAAASNILYSTPPPAPQTYASPGKIKIALMSPFIFSSHTFFIKLKNQSVSPVIPYVYAENKKDRINLISFAENPIVLPPKSEKIFSAKIDTPANYKLYPGTIPFSIKKAPRFYLNETLHYDVYYKFIKIGTQEFSSVRKSDTLLVFNNYSTSTVPFMDINDTMTSVFNSATGQPVKFVKIVNDLGYYAKIYVDFDFENSICTAVSFVRRKINVPWTKQVKMKKINKSCQDELSLIYYIRSLPLFKQHTQQALFMDKPVTYTAIEEKREKNEQLLFLEPLKTKIWISTQRDRIPKKLKYKTRFGYVRAVLRNK